MIPLTLLLLRMMMTMFLVLGTLILKQVKRFPLLHFVREIFSF